jgi:hypothetical protein
MNSDMYHNYLNRSLMMWAGIWVFFMTERIMKMITDHRQVSGSSMQITVLRVFMLFRKPHVGDG